MSDESKDDYPRPWQLDMPLISTQTKTLNTYAVRPGGQPASLTAANVPGTTDFVLGVDTCGFTTASTVTCNFGYECTNVGGYRGCCLPGAGDCASTIYTDCVDHDDISNTADCESQTLCCPSSRPSCYTYWFDDESGPQDTYRHIDCHTSRGFGILYPFPPELTMTSETSTTSTQSSEPSNSDQMSVESERGSSKSAGTIAGAVVGSVTFVIILVIIATLIFRRHRSKKNAAAKPPVPPKSADSSINIMPTPEKEQRQTTAVASPKSARRSFLRPLSLIREHPLAISNPIPMQAGSLAPGIRRHKSAAAHHSPRSNWPLGPPGNPLGSHPVDANLRKRLSDSGLGTHSLESEGSIIAERGQDTLRVPRILPFALPSQPSPPPPPPGVRPVAPLPPLKPTHESRQTTGTSTSTTTPTSATAALKSPRLSHVPVSPIMSRVLDGIGPRRTVSKGSSSASATRPTISSVADLEPVSPIGSDGEEEEGRGHAPRLSYLSSLTTDDDRWRDELVSPIGVDEVGSDTEGPESPVTVSPLESRRGSMDS
ncbi:hypothetical protein K445DRAFT_210481 [Daldinia sp. EC12]|nr:hypothetical protein K445DRAFT_210481 [Daldinia sp. EC12]